MTERESERERDRVQNRGVRSGSSALSTGQSDFSAHPFSQTGPLVLPVIPDGPIHLGRARLRSSEQQRRINKTLCIYFGQTSHLLATCSSTVKDQARQ